MVARSQLLGETLHRALVAAAQNRANERRAQAFSQRRGLPAVLELDSRPAVGELLAAVTRRLLLDSLATGDVGGVNAAMDALVSLYETWLEQGGDQPCWRSTLGRVVMRQLDVDAWITGYERAWRTAGTAGLTELFTDNATYQSSPYEEPVVGLAAIAEMWEAEREGFDEIFTMTSETVAIDGDVVVIRVGVAYGGAVAREYRDLWVIRFAPDGRCRVFEEWPFWPGQPLSSRA